MYKKKQVNCLQVFYHHLQASNLQGWGKLNKLLQRVGKEMLLHNNHSG